VAAAPRRWDPEMIASAFKRARMTRRSRRTRRSKKWISLNDRDLGIGQTSFCFLRVLRALRVYSCHSFEKVPGTAWDNRRMNPRLDLLQPLPFRTPPPAPRRSDSPRGAEAHHAVDRRAAASDARAPQGGDHREPRRAIALSANARALPSYAWRWPSGSSGATGWTRSTRSAR
jgi:hypothetical protein